jgi:mxaA protein
MMQKTRLLHYVMSISLAFCTFATHADVTLPSIDSKYVTVVEQNPTRDAGYVVGDKLERTITLTIKKPFQLVKESLPIVGYEHRYRGQISGIELTDIDVAEDENSTNTQYVIHLTYQVFTVSKLAKPAILRGEIVKIRNTTNKDLWQYRIPHFNFRISPLSVFGSVNLKQELSPFIEPLKISDQQPRQYLTIAAGVLGASLLGLLYILGTHTWLPRMGGAFAKAYRAIRKTDHSTEGLKQALTSLHQAINKTAGHSVFAQTVDAFLAEKPAYQSVKTEIAAFFSLSKNIFFEEANDSKIAEHKAWLLRFCRQMRDCERGLTPEPLPAEGAK